MFLSQGEDDIPTIKFLDVPSDFLSELPSYFTKSEDKFNIEKNGIRQLLFNLSMRSQNEDILNKFKSISE
jgi:hypothetical protein